MTRFKQPDINMEYEILGSVIDFVEAYLISLVTRDNTSSDIKQKILSANRYYFAWFN